MDDVYYSKSSIEEAFKKFPLNWNSFIENTINSIKPSDVRPVVRGKWKCRRFSELAFGFECSVCHTTWDASTYFCPNCGAKLISE